MQTRVVTGLVVNNLVKMNWVASGFIEKKTSKYKPNALVVASQVYKNVDGDIIPVFFTSDTAFLWADNAGEESESLWSIRELVNWLNAGNMSVTFPQNYEMCYIPLIGVGAEECDTDMLAKYGLESFKQDIENRLKDLAVYGETEQIDF